MDYYVRSQLPILSFDEAPEALDPGALREVLCEKPCNVVFVEVRESLYGIVSRGDISRAKNAGYEAVPVNRNFTCIKRKQFMQARELFREKEKIREIPVVDENGRLQGMCSRNDDLLYLEYRSPWEENRYIRPFLKKLKAAYFVRAPKGDDRRQKIIDSWIAEFEKSGVVCEQIDFSGLEEKQNGPTPILVVDEETNCGGYAVTESLDSVLYRSDTIQTFRAYERIMSEHAYDELIGQLAASGIKIYNMFFTEDENTPGRRRLWEGMRRWKQQPGARNINPHVIPSSAEGFFGELNTGDYAAKVGKLYFELETNNIYTRMKDIRGPYLNIINGERVTIGQPAEAERTIWCFGPCFIIGGYVEDKNTIESILQDKLNREGYSCRVVNCGCYETPYQEMIHIASTPMKPGDIIVMHMVDRPIAGTESIDMMDLLDKNDAPAEWMLDLPVHCNHKVNRIYADDLFDRMVRDGVLTAAKDQSGNPSMLTRELTINSLYLDLHYNDFQPKEGETYGSIGMHGNPFTLGHRYLIETAAKQVDRLFCLLIEDELGIFSYAERFAMAVEGTRDLPNVKIVAGGPFQATRNVFREYFVNVQPTDMRESATADTLIYAEIIAKRLGLTYRFLGDEKHNPKMQFFNELMKELLPPYGIHVVELPRAQTQGQSISASAARAAAAEGDTKTLLRHIPETTLRFFIGPEEE